MDHITSTSNLYYGIYRNFAKSSNRTPKSTRKEGSTPESDAGTTEPEGNAESDPNIQHIAKEKSGELSTFVVIKEKTQETFSVIYIVGVLLCFFPYTIYLVCKSLFSSSGTDRVRNESFDLIKEDMRILRILGNDVIARQVIQNAAFVDDDGHERMQIVYEVQGSKGNGRVDVEMLKEDSDWSMQYCIVSTQYSVVPIVDNRPLLDRPIV